jgi:hypothetical protein
MIADLPPVVDVDIQGVEHESQPGPPVDDRERLMTVSNATVVSDPSAS